MNTNTVQQALVQALELAVNNTSSVLSLKASNIEIINASKNLSKYEVLEFTLN